ncbi:DNA-directed RNA polymerase sigma-70 factor [Tenuifilaceae bacterium CYCD]|nr:DNA-directed RNA polymerase sigma-70 factor [Tenuifilaceae bacterium CYCD]
MDKEEFKKEILPLSEKMYRLSFRLLNDTELSKDCVQESFLKLWENRGRLKQLDSIQAFAFTIVRNTCIDKLRKVKRINESSKEMPNHTVESNYDFVESKVLIQQLIQNLPQQQRLIIELRDIEEFEFEEIADTLNLSVNNVRASLSIARKKIKDELTKIYSYGVAKD